MVDAGYGVVVPYVYTEGMMTGRKERISIVDGGKAFVEVCGELSKLYDAEPSTSSVDGVEGVFVYCRIDAAEVSTMVTLRPDGRVLVISRRGSEWSDAELTSTLPAHAFAQLVWLSQTQSDKLFGKVAIQ